MQVEVLIATMKQNDFSIVDKMNIQSKVIIANQSVKNSYETKEYDFGRAKMITTTTIGVGINRNLALLFSDGEYVLLADDDMVYKDGYVNIIENAFRQVPDADAFIFNVDSLYGNSAKRTNNQVKRIRWYNCLSYGCIRICVKRKAIIRENIMFNQNFGGGTLFSAGEDSLFIADMLKKGLKIYTFPETIATVDDDPGQSTWFSGYNKKYYYDKGALFSALSRNKAKILCIQDLLRHKDYKEAGITFFEAYKLMRRGMKGYLELKGFEE